MSRAWEIPLLFDRHNGTEARHHLAAWIDRWQSKHSELTIWVENEITEAFTFCRLPKNHRKHFKRHTFDVRIFQNDPSCLHLIRALVAKQPEEWKLPRRAVLTTQMRPPN